MVLKTNIYFTMVPLSCLFISRSLLRCNYSSVHAVFPSHVFSLLGERFGSMVLWWCWWGLWNPWTITPYCCSSTWAPLILLGGSWDWSHGSGSEEQGHRSQGFPWCSQWGCRAWKEVNGFWRSAAGCTTGIWLSQPWRPSLRVKDCSEEIESTWPSQAKASLPLGWPSWWGEL